MKAIVFKGNASPLEVKEVEKPLVSEGKILVRLHYAALNHLDLLIIKKTSDVPAGGVILGSDGAGIIEETGAGVTAFQKGDEVVINPAINWGPDERVQGPDFDILGFPLNGTFAEYLLIDQSQVHPKPSHLSLKEAAALPLAALTAYRALFTRGNLLPEQHLLITGIGGGVAQFLQQMGLAAGARVSVTSGKEEKLAEALSKGASYAYNYKDTDWAEKAKATAGAFDLIVDSAAGEGFSALLDLVKPGGTIVTLGRTAGPLPSIYPGILYNKQINIHGSLMGSPWEFTRMLKFFETHKLHPVIDRTFPLEEGISALGYLEKGTHTGKVILSMNMDHTS